MPFKTYVVALLFTGALAGCASNPPVVSTGNDTYKVARRAANGFTRPGLLRERATDAAGDYCTQKQQVAVISSVQESPPPFWFGHYPTAEVGFYCRSVTPPAANASAPGTSTATSAAAASAETTSVAVSSHAATSAAVTYPAAN